MSTSIPAVEVLSQDGFDALNAAAAAKVAISLARLGQGNISNLRSVGAGVHEMKINFGPGYRVYFGKDGDELVILLGGRHEKTSATGYS